MTQQRRPSDEEMERLARYWFRAELMREYVHALRDGEDLGGLNKDNWWEFETYLEYWLGALFVLVEGFNKLKLKDARVQKLFNANIGKLKTVRHATYHFVVKKVPFEEHLLEHKGLNWAEELHSAIRDHITEVVLRRAHVERIMKARQATSNK